MTRGRFHPIKGFMAINDISQKEICEVLGMSVVNFHGYLNQEHNFTMEQVEKIADAFDMTNEEIFSVFLPSRKQVKKFKTYDDELDDALEQVFQKDLDECWT